MKKEDLLAYLGILLAIPGVVLLLSDKVALGLLVLLLVVVVLGVYRVLNRPIWTYLEVEKVLTMLDEKGEKASFVSKVRAKANHTGLTQLWFRNLNADGSIQNIRIDGDEVPIKHVAGNFEVYKQFSNGLRRGQTVNVELSCDCINSFLGEREGITHLSPIETKKVRIVVNFHAKRPVIDARRYQGYGGQMQTEMEKPVVSANRLSVTCEFKNPKLGSANTLEWDW